ncbi:neutral ceramidase [Haloechinothrix alba]|uniref:Neutral ceramidase n=1 Tax=Haloechinothrix alba TaxID=664784 RepID=A0A238ZD96_9PSEU|nr:neutral/alkaline non-lysosomal ceramidase N-terminal domain-containing protein [Haloechinothrix alba]SNR81059.1 neutral ceramidase [Haloechinothrix alba]
MASGAGQFGVGRGIADVTGVAAGDGMMGYSRPQQRTAGIHQRLRARAFVVVDHTSGRRIAFVVADLGMIFQAVHQGVLAALAERYAGLYTERNVLLTATHTHAGPGGYSDYATYNLAIPGFRERTYRAVVDGITEAISAAHEDVRPGSIRLGRTELTDASANRSLPAYLRNPAQDRAHFPGAIDPAVTVLRLARHGTDVGSISWFATHGTSLTNRNRLISGDNKGYAAYAWEREHAGVDYLAGEPGFVAAFAQTNAGDMSPNLDLRPGSGPTRDEFANARIIGQRQCSAAMRAYTAAGASFAAGLDCRMRYVDMSAMTVSGEYTPDGRTHRTVPAAIGLPTLAGSVEDGPGIGIPEGLRNPAFDACGRPRWAGVRALTGEQAPKLGVLPAGRVRPRPWTPDVLPVQLVRIGGLYLAAAPAEFTIVAGLRVRRTCARELGVDVDDVVFQGYANAYSQYVTTPEEYDSQQYEGGSTLFGRYTLPAYQQEFAALATALRTGAELDTGPLPRERPRRHTGAGRRSRRDPGAGFGAVLSGPSVRYAPGERVRVTFVTGHPGNDPRRGGSFVEVQRWLDGGWLRHADDGDWSTRYHWHRGIMGPATATITWDVPEDTPGGQYRIVHHGDRVDVPGCAPVPFTGTSAAFDVRR